MSGHGEVTAPATVRLERLLPGPIERVWAHLTEPEKRARWFAGGTSTLAVGRTFTLVFEHARLSHEKATPARWKGVEGHRAEARVTRAEPPRLLAYTWGEADGEQSEVTFELTPVGREVRLVITHRRLRSRDQMVSVASGWHVHAGILRAVLAGEEPPGLWSTLERVESEYADRIPQAVLVRVARRFAFRPERVFGAFLDAAQASRFLFATPAGTMVRADVEARVGGRFVFTDRRDGRDVEHRGEYLEIDRPRRLVFSFAVTGSPDASRVAVDVAPDGSGCVLVLTHELPPSAADHRDRAAAGWTAILAGLERTLGENDERRRR